MSRLIINGDGYGFTEGVTRAIEECATAGIVTSVSVLANFPLANRIADLVERLPELSVGCHLNPVVGRPVLSPMEVPSLVAPNGEFLYRRFRGHLAAGSVRPEEMRAELMAQVERLRALVGDHLTHIDFHQGLENQRKIYPIFLEVALSSGVGRIRTHKYHFGLHRRWPSMSHWARLLWPPTALAKYSYNVWIRQVAKRRGLVMPDVTISGPLIAGQDGRVSLEAYLRLLRNLPRGTVELVAHPGYVDDALRRHATYLDDRERERKILLDSRFREAVDLFDVRLVGYRDIPVSPGGAGRRVSVATS